MVMVLQLYTFIKIHWTTNIKLINMSHKLYLNKTTENIFEKEIH